MSANSVFENLLRREIESLPLLPETQWLPAADRPRAGSSAVRVVGLAAAVALALAAGSAIRDWRAEQLDRQQVAAPAPAASGTHSPSPTALASPTPVLGAGAPRCPAGEVPILDVEQPPPPGDQPGTGSASAEAAFRKRYPNAADFTMFAWGSNRPAQSSDDLGRGPVWIVAGSETYVALAPGTVDGTNNWFVYPAKFLGCRIASAGQRTSVARSSLEIDDYRFTVFVLRDGTYGPQPSAGASTMSAIPGIALGCDWTRTGPDVATLESVWGTPTSVAPTVGYSNVRTGARGTGLHGVPSEALKAGVATVVCGVRDGAGDHGVVIELTVPPDDQYTDGSLKLSRWPRP